MRLMAETVASPVQPDPGPDVAPRPGQKAELREAERAIKHWNMKVVQFGSPPPLMAFELSQMLKRDWAYRFLISADAMVENHAFLLYGSRFATLLDLPQLPARDTPMMEQLPERYRPLFAQGCEEATQRKNPVRLNGICALEDGGREAYRASFMPVAIRPNSLTQLVYGAFNCRLLRPKRATSRPPEPATPADAIEE
jgi:hypothetical protein